MIFSSSVMISLTCQPLKPFFMWNTLSKIWERLIIFLGIEIASSSTSFIVSQHKYLLDILQDTNLTEATPCDTSLPSSCKLHLDKGAPLDNPTQCRTPIGRLLYLTITRLDISFAILELSQYMAHPTHYHFKMAHRVCKYLKRMSHPVLLFCHASSLLLTTFTDADWGCCQILESPSLAMLFSLVLALSLGKLRSSLL